MHGRMTIYGYKTCSYGHIWVWHRWCYLGMTLGLTLWLALTPTLTLAMGPTLTLPSWKVLPKINQAAMYSEVFKVTIGVRVG